MDQCHEHQYGTRKDFKTHPDQPIHNLHGVFHAHSIFQIVVMPDIQSLSAGASGNEFTNSEGFKGFSLFKLPVDRKMKVAVHDFAFVTI